MFSVGSLVLLVLWFIGSLVLSVLWFCWFIGSVGSMLLLVHWFSGSGDGYCEEGGVGTCFVTEYQITVFAETNASGGVDLWQEKTEPFIGTDRMGLGTNYRTIEEVEAAVEAADYSVTADYDAIASLFEHLKAAQAAIDNILNQTH